VTTYDKVSTQSAASLLTGVFINPATVNGQANTPTPGNWIMIFVGQGSVNVNIGTATGTTIGNTVSATGSGANGFTSNNSNATDATTLGIAMTAPSVAFGARVRVDQIFSIIPN
jgi:hypothetical protein